MKIIFLDVDGVLNSTATWNAMTAGNGCHGSGEEAMCPELVARLNRLVEQSGAAIVLSSAWRYDSVTRTREMLRKRGIIGKLIGCTPRLRDTLYVPVHKPARDNVGWGPLVQRGLEIQSWLDSYTRPVESFVIIDDNNDMAHMIDRLVLTDYQVGLQDADVERALDILEVPWTRA